MRSQSQLRNDKYIMMIQKFSFSLKMTEMTEMHWGGGGGGGGEEYDTPSSESKSFREKISFALFELIFRG